MIRLLFLSILLSIGLLSCDKSSELQSFSGEFEWLCGAEAGYVEKKIDFPVASTLTLDVESISLCPNTGVELKVVSDGELLFETFVTEFPDSFQISIPAGSSNLISSETKTIPNSTVLCVWLGNARVLGRY